MKFEGNRHHRRSIRLPSFDYSSRRAYFVTICMFERLCLFEDEYWRILTDQVWETVAGGAGPLDEFVVMPNHVHGIIWIRGANPVGAQQRYPVAVDLRRSASRQSLDGSRFTAVAAPLQRRAVAPPVVPGSLAAIVRAFKSATAKRLNNLRGTPGLPVWQRNYYERVVRNGEELNLIREYIRDNPRKWAADRNNPANIKRTSGQRRPP